jgi:REP element-mobilizing transposase RayT
MSTYTQILYQIVFSTKDRERSLSEENREQLFKYIWGILKIKNCKLYRINGVQDHLHIATHLHPTIPLATLVKDIKVSSAIWIKEQRIFPDFKGWQEGYGAFTYGSNEKNKLINYIMNQQEHHILMSFKDEYIKLLKENGIEFNEKYLL